MATSWRSPPMQPSHLNALNATDQAHAAAVDRICEAFSTS
jgi:hypothetical protein